MAGRERPAEVKMRQFIDMRHRLRFGAVGSNSVYLIGTTVITSLFGYLYWILAARLMTSAQVGLVSGLISATLVCSLFTHLGPGMWLIEQLPRREGTPAWGRLVGSSLLYTSLLTGVVVAVLLGFWKVAGTDLGAVLTPVVVACILLGAFATSVTSVSGFVFISASRSRFHMLLNSSISAAKLLLLLAAACWETGPTALLWTWALSAVGGAALATLVLLPRLRFGRLSIGRLSFDTAVAGRITSHHVTSAAGALLPYLLPVLVLVKLGPRENAYFYAAWMVAGAVFMVGPSVASALFSAGVRTVDNLAAATRTSLKFCTLILPACLLGCAVLGRYVLGIFGPGYAEHGYAVLLVLVVASIPDAFSSIAISALRATGNVTGAMRLNLLISVTALTAAWLLLPLGIVGVGTGWMIGQTIGSVAVTPWMIRLLRRPPGEGRPPAPTPADHRTEREASSNQTVPESAIDFRTTSTDAL
jgi:O-antigen/teichoic acid export membrane protein